MVTVRGHSSRCSSLPSQNGDQTPGDPVLIPPTRTHLPVVMQLQRHDASLAGLHAAVLEDLLAQVEVRHLRRGGQLGSQEGGRGEGRVPGGGQGRG